MTNQGLQNCLKVKEQIKKHEFSDSQKAYPIVFNSLTHLRKLYSDWLDIHSEYATGFSQLPIASETEERATRLVSNWVTDRSTSFRKIVYAKIPVEVYFLVAFYFNLFHSNTPFVLQENRQFQSANLEEELQHELKGLLPPAGVKSRIEPLVYAFSKQHMQRISYDANEYSSPQSWLILFHEAGHELYDSRLWRQHNPRPTESWSKELLIDMTACYTFGPAYAVAFSNYHRIWPGGYGTEHLKEPARLYASMRCTKSLIDRMGAVEMEFLDKMRLSYRILVDTWKTIKDQSKDDQEMVDSVFDSATNGINLFLKGEMIPSFDEFVLNYQKSAIQFEPKLKKILVMIDSKIPVSVDPRLLFNSIFDKPDINPLLVTESLKRWLVVKEWQAIEEPKII